MKGKIFKIKNMKDELVLPITTTEAVYSEDGKTLNDEINNINSSLDKNVQQLTNKINEVANKGTTTEVVENTTKTVISEKIADGTIANLTIENNTITTDKYQDNSVTPEKTDFFTILKSKNVANPSFFKKGFSQRLKNNGDGTYSPEIYEDANFSLYDGFIEVQEGETYSSTVFIGGTRRDDFIGQIYGYDSNKKYKARLTVNGGDGMTLIPSGIKYVNFRFQSNYSNDAYFGLGNTAPSAFEEYYVKKAIKEEFISQDIDKIKFENENLINRCNKLENLIEFEFKNFDKGQVTFVFDDGNNDIDLLLKIFKEYNYPLNLAVPYTKLDNVTTGTGEGKTVREICREVEESGGEILVHNLNVVTSENQYDYDYMYNLFAEQKNYMLKEGFNVRGIILSGGTNAIAGNLITEEWCKKYYDYSDAYGTKAPFLNIRKRFMDSVATNKSNIDIAERDKTWVSFVAHTIEGSEGILTETTLREILDYCKTKNINVTTYSKIYDTFATTKLEKRLTALESK